MSKIDFDRLYEDLPFLRKGKKLKFQPGGKFTSNNNVQTPELVRNIPRAIKESTGDWDKGYLREQTNVVVADRCFEIIQGIRKQVKCDSTKQDQIVIPPGTTKKGEDEIFYLEETKRTKGSYTPGIITKGNITLGSKDEYNAVIEKGTGKHFKEQGCTCGSFLTEEVSIGALKAKLSNLPRNAQSTKNWTLDLIAKGAKRGATDNHGITLTYSKKINGQPGTLDLALQNGCMCGGSGKISTDPIIDPGIETDPTQTPDKEEIARTKAIKGEYESESEKPKLKEERPVNVFEYSFMLEWKVPINNREITRQGTGFLYGEVVFDSQGNSSVNWKPLTITRNKYFSEAAAQNIKNAPLRAISNVPLSGQGYILLKDFSSDSQTELEAYLNGFSPSSLLKTGELERLATQQNAEAFNKEKRKRTLTEKGTGQDLEKNPTGEVDMTKPIKKRGGLFTLRLKRVR